MDQNLAYLREVLSNYTEANDLMREINRKIEQGHYASEGAFVRDLNEEEIRSLESILDNEINHANEAGDLERGYQLNGVFELLY
ncbi:sporulation protein [Rossellomorea vietnamensis]|uniref:Sporulation protein n=2 Tax=Rossellomorea TaxID=2837508 RepID=A0A5D4K6K0_9BACI|nr:MULTISPECIES: sigma-G-dependent sporulation-specific acid-soluble spore protein CsgA [Rossellomorea]TYR72981.1 sporulation protein [Rossellomorea vietnamensis]TYS80862.1 sporulation protein [Rossellomorea aquimaris]